MMLARRWTVVLSIAALAVAANSWAQPSGSTTGAGALDKAGDDRVKLDLSVPESPAFKALGVLPQEVIRPNSPQDLAGQLLNGVDAHGNLQTGFALDTNLFMLGYGNHVTLDQYHKNYFVKLLARTQESLATTKGSSDDDKSVRFAAGFRVTPWDEGDPREDDGLIKCIRENLNKNNAEMVDLVNRITDLKIDIQSGGLNETDLKMKTLEIEMLNTDLKKQSDTLATICREAARAKNWNASAWSLGVAPTWVSSTGNVDDLQWNTASVWTSLGYGFENVPGLEDDSQLLVSARYNHDEEVPDLTKSDGSFIQQRSLVVAFQLRLAAYRPVPTAAPNLIVSVEGDYLYVDPKHAKHDSSYRVSLGADFKIPRIENTYIKISAGGAGGSDREDNQGFVSATIRHGS